MTARGGAYIVLGFATLWLWTGASALPMPWRAIAGGLGVIVLLAVAWHVLVRPASSERAPKFDRRKFRITVALEITGGILAGWLLGRTGLTAYLWPAIGIVVALHFIGLWWATHDPRFIALTVAMLAVNIIALCFGPGPTMLVITGLGSAACLAGAMVRR